MKSFILKYWPIIVIFFIWFIFSSPYFLKGDAPYPAIYQNNFFSPWADYEQYTVPVKNNAISDVVTQIYPWKHYTIEELKKGRIPWWNPFSFSGNPHVADFQTAVFSPFNLLFFILPFIDAWSFLILLQPLLAGLFMLLFLRQLKISKEGSLLGSIAFMFCGFIVVWMPYGTLSMAITFLPLSLYAIEKSFERPKFSSLILLSLCVAASFFSGHFQTSLYLILYVLAFLLFKFFSTHDKRTALKVLVFIIGGLIISLIQIIPSLEIYQHSVRSELFSNKGAIPVRNLITVFAPDFFGNPVTRNDWLGNYAEWASFIGIIPLLLVIISLLGKKENKNIRFFLFAGIAAIFLAIDTPLQSLLVSLKLPVFSTSIPSRIIVFFSFSFTVLAAYGLDSLKKLLDNKKIKKVILSCVSLIFVILFIWLLLFITLPKDKALIAARNLLLPSGLLFFGSILITLSLKIKTKRYVNLVIYLFILLTMIDSFRFAQKWVPFDPKELVFPDIPVISAMQKSVGSGRVYGKFGSYIDTYYRLPSIEGYDPLYIRRYGEFLTSASKGTYQPAVRSLAVLDKSGKYSERVIDLLGVTVLFHVIGDTGKDWAFPVWAKDEYGKYKYSVFYQDDKFQLLSNKRALPRAKLFYDYEVIKNDKEIIKRLYSENFDFRNELILEEDPGLKITGTVKGDKAVIVSHTPEKVIIKVSSHAPGLLFLSDNYYPKWKARVNGLEAKVFRADYTLRSVLIPKGESRVEFYYSP
ncbi:YfhO family protein [Patescibacteria group bacterium]|nr:YfhO family protein [Patescibacteria group bacterium]MBU4098738.1 YfhO family protein [Patescibacteria group bacterium]